MRLQASVLLAFSILLAGCKKSIDNSDENAELSQFCQEFGSASIGGLMPGGTDSQKRLVIDWLKNKCESSLTSCSSKDLAVIRKSLTELSRPDGSQLSEACSSEITAVGKVIQTEAPAVVQEALKHNNPDSPKGNRANSVELAQYCEEFGISINEYFANFIAQQEQNLDEAKKAEVALQTKKAIDSLKKKCRSSLISCSSADLVFLKKTIKERSALSLNKLSKTCASALTKMGNEMKSEAESMQEAGKH
jgi:hypothetical protein